MIFIFTLFTITLLNVSLARDGTKVDTFSFSFSEPCLTQETGVLDMYDRIV